MKGLRIIWLLTILFVSCEEELTREINPVDNDLLVVDAILTNEKMNHLVKLSHVNTTTNASWNPASGATVAISDGDNVQVLVEFPANSGLYFTNENFRALFGKQYVLFIQYNGKNYAATDSAVPGEPFNNDSIYLQKEEGLFTLNFVKSRFPSMTRYFINWQNTDFCASSGETCLAKIVDYDLKTVDINESFRPPKEQVLFPKGSIIIRKRYSISEPYKQFLRSMLSETEWRGGYFDVQRGNVITNLSEGAVGFFAVTTVVSDTTIVQ
jgi:hypothetical protein